MQQPDSAAYLIVDSEHVEYPKMPLVPLIDGFETVAEMAAALGLPTGRRCRRRSTATTSTPRDGEDPDFHKSADWLAVAGHRRRGRSSTCASARRCTPASPSAASG